MSVGVAVFVFVIVLMRSIVVMMIVRLHRRCGRDLVLSAYAELGGGDAGANHPLGPDGFGRNGQLPERGAHVVERDAGVDQRSEQHVARSPRKAVQIQRVHVVSILSAAPCMRRSTASLPDSTSEK